VPEVRDQGPCGSCYTLSIISVLESRIRIMYGEEINLSPQFSLSCNFLTEGCDGGWSIFVGIFAETFGLVEESCASYKANTD
jgi:cathepsin C